MIGWLEGDMAEVDDVINEHFLSISCGGLISSCKIKCLVGMQQQVIVK